MITFTVFIFLRAEIHTTRICFNQKRQKKKKIKYLFLPLQQQLCVIDIELINE